MPWVRHPRAAIQPSSSGPPSHVMNENGGGGASGAHPPAKYDERSRWSPRRMLIEKPGAERICRPALVSFPRQNSTSGGSSDSDVNEFAVIARISPSTSIAITVTPVTKRPTVCRRVRESTGIRQLPTTNSHLPTAADSRFPTWALEVTWESALGISWELAIWIWEQSFVQLFGVVIFFMMTLTSS